MSLKQTQNKYNVHVFANVRIKVENVPAANPLEAIKLTDNINFSHLINKENLAYEDGPMTVNDIDWAGEAPDCFLVDKLLSDGEVDHENTVWLDVDGDPLVDGLNKWEHKGRNAELASLLTNEILSSVETLGGLSATCGSWILSDIIYLNLAILDGDKFQYNKDHSSILDVLKDLPSVAKFLPYIEPEDERSKRDIDAILNAIKKKSSEERNKLSEEHRNRKIKLAEDAIKDMVIETAVVHAWSISDTTDREHFLAVAFFNYNDELDAETSNKGTIHIRFDDRDNIIECTMLATKTGQHVI